MWVHHTSNKVQALLPYCNAPMLTILFAFGPIPLITLFLPRTKQGKNYVVNILDIQPTSNVFCFTTPRRCGHMRFHGLQALTSSQPRSSMWVVPLGFLDHYNVDVNYFVICEKITYGKSCCSHFLCLSNIYSLAVWLPL